MNEKRIVITGIGVLAPNGIGKNSFWSALKEGVSGIKVINRFDTNEFKAKLGGEINDFKAADFLGEKGLRGLDRTTRFICASAKMAIEDSNLEIDENTTDAMGVCTGTTLSSLWSIAEFDRGVIKDGPLFSDVGLFPGTVVNAASSQVSIRFNIRGFNATISNGYTSSLDALKYASDFIRLGRVNTVVLGAVESLSLANFTGFYNLGFLAGIKGEEVSCPFDKRRNGIILSEGAGVVILEDEEKAKRRKANIYAEVKGIGSYFDAYRMASYEPEAKGLRISMLKAIEKSRLNFDDIDCISAAANSVFEQDKLESKAIRDAFGKNAKKIPITSIKSMLGETFSSSGLLQLIAAIASINENVIHPTINYRVDDPECDLNYVTNNAKTKKINNVLINNFGPGGNNASLVISKYQ